MEELLAKLKACKHDNKSLLMPVDRLRVCFACGATKRPDETGWTWPLLWREL